IRPPNPHLPSSVSRPSYYQVYISYATSWPTNSPHRVPKTVTRPTPASSKSTFSTRPARHPQTTPPPSIASPDLPSPSPLPSSKRSSCPVLPSSHTSLPNSPPP